ncbi:amino acid ABC transporter substrate-binding protein [Arcanobacterium hippocoleae]|uniref:Polar amino acid transport system substrate-binding protein n=2 Tax=Arcanobacterium hippocoleae TaxID=149017 RepID=A0ABU1T0W0_9ACTO|nr:amino acid ABC transporter substrate-binding protein [Arcanobacterium hippocoleae]MDR6938929.1 polar amino acid transport system substrate-binding protein [Arcanobacterium hippocoleae]
MGLRKIIATATALFLAVSLSACSPSKSNDAEKGATNHAAKSAGDTFTVGFDASFPPFGYKDEETGEYTGFDIELAAEVAKRNDWQFKPQPIDWDAKDAELNSGTIDAIWNGFTMNGREDKYTFSEPYVDNSIVFVTKQDANIKDVKALAGKVVLVQADSSGLTALQDEKNKELVASFADLQQVPEYNNAFMTLEAGAADAIAVDLGVAKFQLAKRGTDKFAIMEPPFHTEQYGIGFKKGNTQLRDQVQKTLDEMRTDGTFMQLAKKYKLENAVVQK